MKTYIALIMLFITVSFSIDLHSLSHVFETSDEESHDKHCELCIINYNKEQKLIALEPLQQEIEQPEHVLSTELFDKISSKPEVVNAIYFEGQLFSRPPPYYL